jgi:hypothetical protein
MTEDRRQFRSSDDLANAIFGSVPLTAEQQRQREAAHVKAQELPPPPKEEPKPPGWLPPGTITNNTVSFAFRDTRPPTEREIARDIAKTMAGVVGDARGRR